MDSVIVEGLVSGGPSAILAFIIFIMFCKEVKEHRAEIRSHEEKLRQDRIFMEDRLSVMIKEDKESREENTKALTELVTLLQRINGRGGK